MDAQTPTGEWTHRVRPARAADLRHLAAIEDSGDTQFRERFGEAIVPALVEPAISGHVRAEKPGFLLVHLAAGSLPDGPPDGFVHVLDLQGHAHLEQLSVLPRAQRHGIGAALVRAAMAEAAALGFDRLTLCTYRNVAWNGPFYAGLGFSEVRELAPYERELREHEVAIGLDVNDERCVMEVALPREVTGR
jgi:ribosomal protein S18 acetylase RimI-like enzyme